MSAPTPPEPARLARNPPSISMAVNQHEFKWWKRLQSAGIGAVLLAVGGVASKGCDKLEVVNVAMAQTSAQTAVNTTRITAVETHLEAVDAGARVEVANLRREMAEARIDTDKKLTDMSITLQAVLREVRKK